MSTAVHPGYLEQVLADLVRIDSTNPALGDGVGAGEGEIARYVADVMREIRRLERKQEALETEKEREGEKLAQLKEQIYTAKWQYDDTRALRPGLKEYALRRCAEAALEGYCASLFPLALLARNEELPGRLPCSGPSPRLR